MSPVPSCARAILLGYVKDYKVQLSMYTAISSQAIETGRGLRMTSTNEAKQSQNGIEVNGLVRVFKGDVRAVDGIDLEVKPGEIYGFLGPNGAGKSTTVHMLTTLLPPTAGSARVAGHGIVREGAAVRRSIG